MERRCAVHRITARGGEQRGRGGRNVEPAKGNERVPLLY